MSNPFLAFRRNDEFNFGDNVKRGLPAGVHLEFYGGGKGGSSTQSVSIPPEVMARYNAVNARAENVAATPFTPYSNDPNAFVADLTSSQKAGISNINALQGMATPDVQEGQGLQRQGIGTAVTGQNQANAIDQAALQGISQAQQQGTAYNQAAGKNIFNAMDSAAPYMNQMGQLTQQGLGQGQQYLGGATDLTRQAIATGQQYANQAQPYYTGAMQAAQPFNAQAQNYLQQGTQAVNPNALDYSQYMNPFMGNVVQAQQALQAQENAQQRSAMQGKAIQSGAFGGDRAGIEQANLARQQSLANQATLANLLQSGYGQAQAAAQQQQGVGLGAAQANRAAQQQAAAQAAALGQQQYAQNLGLGQGLAALGQQQYGQALGTGAQINQLGQAGFQQNLGAGAQLGQLGQNLYAQNIGQGQAIQGLGNQQFNQGLQGSQAAAGIGQNIFGNAAQTAGIQQAGGMNIGNLGLQNQAAQIAAAQAQMAAGQQQQQTQQAGKTALYNQYLQQQGYPFQVAQFLANIAEGTGALSGSTTTAQRTGQRGGRMGDGYASGGLVPDSQGGAVYDPGLYGRGGFDDGGVAADAQSQAAIDKNAAVLNGTADKTNEMTEAQKAMPFNADANALAGLDPKIADLYQKELGRTPDAAGARYWQDMLNAGMSIDQIKYNMDQSPEYLRKSGDVNALKGAPLTYDPSKFTNAPAPVQNRYGAFSAGDFTPNNMVYGQRLMGYGQQQFGYGQQPMGYGQQPMNYSSMGGYGGYGGGLGGGYGMPQAPSNYGMPNFGSSAQYGGAPDYAGAMQYGTMQSQAGYGMPQFGGFQQQPQYGGYQQQPQFGGYQQQPQYGGYQPQVPAIPQNIMNQYANPSQQQMSPAQNAQYGQFQQQQTTPQATGKGAAPTNGTTIPQGVMDQYASAGSQQAPTATGKGASSPSPSTGKGPSGMKDGGRTAFADGGRAGYAAGGDPSSVLRALAGQYDPGDPQGLVARQAAMFAGAPGASAAGYVPAVSGAGQHQMLQPQRSILPEEQSGIKNAVSMGTSIASLGEAGGKLYDKLTSKPKTGETAGSLKEGIGNAVDKTKNFFGFGDKAASMDIPNLDVASMPDAAGKGISAMAANGGRIGHNSGGRAGFGLGGIPGLDDLRKGQADIPGGDGSDTPMGNVVKQGTQTPAELKSEMDKLGGGGGGLGGGGGGDNGIAGAIGTASSIVGLGNAAMSAGSWIGANVLPFLVALSDKRMKTDIEPIGKTFDGQTIHRYRYKGDPKTQIGLIAQEVEEKHPNAVGLAGGMKTVNYKTATNDSANRGHFAAGGGVKEPKVDVNDPRYRQMEVAFDNLLKRYDNNPLLAAAAMDVGVKAVDAAIMKSHQQGGEVTDYLPRRVQEYMFALSQAALGAHRSMGQQAAAPAPRGLMPRAAGGRTGYALPGFVDEENNVKISPDAPFEGSLVDNAEPTGLVPRVQVAEATTSDAPKTTPTGSKAARTYFDYLTKEKGYDPHVAAGILGNAYHESKGLQPAIVGDQGDAIGLFQFHSKGEQPAFKQWAQENKKDVADPYAQLDFVDSQLRGPYAKTLEEMQAAKNPNAAAEIFMRGYERPKAGPTEALAQRQAYADAIASGKELPKFGAQPVQVAAAPGLAGGTSTDAPSPWASSIGKILPDAVPTDSSFWVPLIAGLGSMLASNQYRFSQRLGEGLIGGAAAYGKQQEFQQKNEQQAQLMGLKKQEMGFTEREVALKEAEQKRRIDAAKAAAAALSGNVSPVQPYAPVPTAKTTVAPPSIGGAQPSTPNNAAPAIPPVEDTDKTPAAPIPSPNSSFWENVDPQSNPHNLLALADRFDQAAAAAAEDPSSMASYRASAQQYRAQANAIRQSGIVTMKDQSTASMPGFNEAKAAQAAALKKAELDVINSPDAQAAATNLKRLEKEAQEPFDIKSKSREVEFPIQFKARTDAANEATVGRNLLQQTDAMMNLMFDEKGDPVVNSGPLGAAINKMAAIAKQAGFSDSFIKDVLATDPSNAQSIEKLRTTLSTEIGRQEMNGAPIRVTEFQRFLENTPGETLLPKSFKWIVENILQPKAKSSIGAYEKVKRMNPAEHNIQAELDDYARDNKWYGVNPGQQTETEPRKATPATAPVSAIPPGQEDNVIQEMQRRKAARGAQ